MSKIKFILFIMVIILILINNVSAVNLIQNPGFETGTNSSWTVYHEDYGIHDIDVGYANNSNYGLKLYTGWYGIERFSQTIDLTNVNYLEYDYKIISSYSSPYYPLIVSIGGNNIKFYYSATTNYQHDKLDISGYTGIQEVKFWVSAHNVMNGCYLDNIIADDGTGGSSTISFYSTQTNITPTHVNYSIIDDDASNDYSLMIYRNVSGNSYYIDSVGWYHTEEGSAPIQISEYGANCTYYASLYAIGQGYNRVIATCEREYIFDGAGIEPFPTPEPTPNITALPTFTPPPTPIPPDQPNIDNGSLNMSWMQGYYNLVDNVMNGLFHPIYNMTSYIMIPVNVLSSTISGFMNQAELSFEFATVAITKPMEVLNIFFGVLPDKILNVITYYLVCLVILLIMKGDT